MSDDRVPGRRRAGKNGAGGIDCTVPHSARVWDYWLGGKDHYPADRQAAEEFRTAYQGITDAVGQLRYFTARAVRYLAAEAGIRQFLEIGTGLPFHRDPVHKIALGIAADCRIEYADNDPLVLAHARALLTGPPGTVTHIEADLEDPAGLLDAARDGLDFGRPVAILLGSTLGHVGDPRKDDDEAALLVTGQLKDALPPGGYLVIGDLVANPGLEAALDSYNATGAAPYRARTAEQFTRHFIGLDLADGEPGPASRWQPEHSPFTFTEGPAWGAAGRKP